MGLYDALNPERAILYLDMKSIYNASGSNVLIDGDMEAISADAWSPNAATLSKQTINPHGGSRCLRIATTGSVATAFQYCSTALRTYRARGWCRSDGATTPAVSITSSVDWTGTTSTEWQYFDLTRTAGNSQFYLVGMYNPGGYVEFDDVIVETTQNYVTNNYGGLGPATIQAGNGEIVRGYRKLYANACGGNVSSGSGGWAGCVRFPCQRHPTLVLAGISA